MSARVAFFVLTCWMSAATATFAAEQPPPFLPKLQQVLLSGTHKTRIVLGTFWQFYDDQTHRDYLRRIDTEVSPDGGVEYLCTKGDFNLDGTPVLSLSALVGSNFYLKPSKMKSLPAGTTVRVGRVEIKKDHLEVGIDPSSIGGVHGKIKLMLGKGFEKTATYDSVMPVVARALVVEAYEAGVALEAEWKTAMQELDASRAKLTAPDTTSVQKLEAAEAHRTLLQAAAQLAQQLQASGLSKPEAAVLASELAQTEARIASLQAAAVAERIADVDRAVATANDRVTSLLAQARTGGPSQAAARLSLLDECDSVIKQREALLKSRTEFGAPPTQPQAAKAAADAKAAAVLREQISSQKNAAERAGRLAQLDREWAQLEKAVATSREAYTRSFGTPQQEGEARKLQALLKQARENRAAAARLGSDSAAEQTLALQRELQRLQRVAP